MRYSTLLRVPTFCTLHAARCTWTSAGLSSLSTSVPQYLTSSRPIHHHPPPTGWLPFPPTLVPRVFLWSPPLLSSSLRILLVFLLHHRYRRPFSAILQPFFLSLFFTSTFLLNLCSHYGHRHSFRAHFIP
ncbi:hypothetical protein F5B21DRAFT_336303 [Xylaria acuta]|nr:hypothetical protein F5B21DRAFT_336303 [Xylaria acuta]